MPWTRETREQIAILVHQSDLARLYSRDAQQFARRASARLGQSLQRWRRFTQSARILPPPHL